MTVRMDSLVTAAARALAAGDPLAALDRVALRDDPPALALRGTAMAQLGDLERARVLLSRAVRAFGSREAVARARCVVALSEVALAAREPPPRGTSLEQAIAFLEARGDGPNARYGQLVGVRRDLLFGHLDRAEAGLAAMTVSDTEPLLLACYELARAQVALRRVQGSAARAALLRARTAAERAGIPRLLAEIDCGLASLATPAARSLSRGQAESLTIEQVERVLTSQDVVIDASRRSVAAAPACVRLARRPVLFALMRSLGMAWPAGATRGDLMRAAFEVTRANDSHRARLRVEIGRLRRLLRGLATVESDGGGYRLCVAEGRRVRVLVPPIDGPDAELQALLSDGERWSTSMLAAAARTSQRSVQRALAGLEQGGRVRAIGRGRAQRWVAEPPAGFTTVLLLAGLGAGE